MRNVRYKIYNVALQNYRRLYIQRLGLAEHYGTCLKKFYQEAFPNRPYPFPSSITIHIGKFLCGDDENVLKRFVNAVKSPTLSHNS